MNRYVNLEASTPVVALVAVAVALLGHGCFRYGFNEHGDVVSSDGARDGPSTDGARDGPSTDSTQDGPEPDQQSGDAGVAPGTWVSITRGMFMMGSPTSEPCRGPDEDHHNVSLTRDFEIQSTEVTQGQFWSLMGYNPSTFSSCGPTCPVEEVNWHQAAAYCNALSQLTGRTPCYSCTGNGSKVTCQEAGAYKGQQVYECPGYRLPTDAEWEYAYRASTTTAYYSGVNDAGKCTTCSSTDANAVKVAWYCANAGAKSHPVAQKAANAWGLYDMAGNLGEWCHDWYTANLGTSAVTNPAGPPTGTNRVKRGGSWFYGAHILRAADRGDGMPSNAHSDTGFRCCRRK